MLIKKTLFRKECRKFYKKLFTCLNLHIRVFPDENRFIFEYSPFIH
jgi:hypothetical protein